MGLLRQDMDKMRCRLSLAEQRLGHAEDTVVEHATNVRSLQTSEYKNDNEDAENHNLRNNLRIVGLAEGVTGPNQTICRESAAHLTTGGPVLSLLCSGEGPPYSTQAWTPWGTITYFYPKISQLQR